VSLLISSIVRRIKTGGQRFGKTTHKARCLTAALVVPRKTTIRVAAAGIAVLGLMAGGAHAAFAAKTPSASAAIESS
jgi:hypothetical protein